MSTSARLAGYWLMPWLAAALVAAAFLGGGIASLNLRTPPDAGDTRSPASSGHQL
ncbi:MAG: hypothetical protein OXF78_04050 [Rhodospirillales bacterium]|nr:hypothetical protein [Rhodospirillales bacterium]